MTKETKIREFLDTLYKGTHNRVEGDGQAVELFGSKSPFRIICTKCGSMNIEIIGERGVDYGGETGYSPGSTVIKCLKCGAAITAAE